MKRHYTDNFPDAHRAAAQGNDPLEGLSFVFYVSRWTRDLARWIFPGVLSPYWRLMHCTRGSGVVQFGVIKYVLNRSNLILIPPDVNTDFYSSAPLDMLWTHFLPLLPVPFDTTIIFDRPILLNIHEGHRHLIRALTNPKTRHGVQSTDQLRFRALLDMCFAEILECHADQLWNHAPVDARAIKMLTIMRGRFGESLTNAQIAGAVGLNRDQAMRLFRQVAGTTMQARLREIRLGEAACLLATTDLSIKQIASECGFADRFHFTRLFIAKTGVGPATFRRRFRATNPKLPGPDASSG